MLGGAGVAVACSAVLDPPSCAPVLEPPSRAWRCLAVLGGAWRCWGRLRVLGGAGAAFACSAVLAPPSRARRCWRRLRVLAGLGAAALSKTMKVFVRAARFLYSVGLPCTPAVHTCSRAHLTRRTRPN